jgi:hypothetical protein
MSHVDHHAPSPPVAPERFPWAAKAAFWTGLVALYGVLIPRFGPIGFVAGILTVLLTPIAIAQARRSDRSARLAVAGLACALVAITIWLVAREDWPHVIGGDDAWPSFIMPDQQASEDGGGGGDEGGQPTGTGPADGSGEEPVGQDGEGGEDDQGGTDGSGGEGGG